MKSTITRQEFLQRTALAGAALLLSSLEGFALEHPQKKIKVGDHRMRKCIYAIPSTSFKIALCRIGKHL